MKKIKMRGAVVFIGLLALAVFSACLPRKENKKKSVPVSQGNTPDTEMQEWEKRRDEFNRHIKEDRLGPAYAIARDHLYSDEKALVLQNIAQEILKQKIPINSRQEIKRWTLVSQVLRQTKSSQERLSVLRGVSSHVIHHWYNARRAYDGVMLLRAFDPSSEYTRKSAKDAYYYLLRTPAWTKGNPYYAAVITKKFKLHDAWFEVAMVATVTYVLTTDYPCDAVQLADEQDYSSPRVERWRTKCLSQAKPKCQYLFVKGRKMTRPERATVGQPKCPAANQRWFFLQ